MRRHPQRECSLRPNSSIQSALARRSSTTAARRGDILRSTRGVLSMVTVAWMVVGSIACDEATGDNPVEPESPIADPLAPQSRVPRLSHAQWQRAAADLLLIDDVSSVSVADLRSDPNFGGAIFERFGQLRVDEALWSGYQRSAETLALRVVNDSDLLAQLAPLNPDLTLRKNTFIQTQGLRAHRRPLTQTEFDTYSRLFDLAPSLYPNSPDAFAAGVRAIIEAWLQSPYFLYRPELSTGPSGTRAPLGGFEVASRLSFALWGTMPDAALFDAAADGTLLTRDGVRAQAERLLADERGAVVIEDFHARLFDVESYAQISPPADFGVASDFGAMAAEEHRLFVRDIFSTGGGLEALLTSTTSFANADLRNVYGLPEGGGEAFESVSLDATQRRGILTHVGFLARNAAGGVADPIHRGVFVSSRLACNTIPPPPDDIPPYPVPEGQTNRQQIEALTEREGTNCAECHTTLINPYGFPFENFNAIGAFQTEDNGLPVDPSSSFLLGADQHDVGNALELIDRLAASSVVHACYASSWLEYLYGREKGGNDDDTAAEIGDLSLSERASLVDILLALVESDAFRFRPANEDFGAGVSTEVTP